MHLSAGHQGKLKTFAIVSTILGAISFIWLIMDYLALTDIWQGGEPNLHREWFVVALSFIPIILFHVCVFLTLFFVFKSTKKLSSNQKV